MRRFHIMLLATLVLVLGLSTLLGLHLVSDAQDADKDWAEVYDMKLAALRKTGEPTEWEDLSVVAEAEEIIAFTLIKEGASLFHRIEREVEGEFILELPAYISRQSWTAEERVRHEGTLRRLKPSILKINAALKRRTLRLPQPTRQFAASDLSPMTDAILLLEANACLGADAAWESVDGLLRLGHQWKVGSAAGALLRESAVEAALEILHEGLAHEGIPAGSNVDDWLQYLDESVVLANLKMTLLYSRAEMIWATEELREGRDPYRVHRGDLEGMVTELREMTEALARTGHDYSQGLGRPWSLLPWYPPPHVEGGRMRQGVFALDVFSFALDRCGDLGRMRDAVWRVVDSAEAVKDAGVSAYAAPLFWKALLHLARIRLGKICLAAYVEYDPAHASQGSFSDFWAELDKASRTDPATGMEFEYVLSESSAVIYSPVLKMMRERTKALTGRLMGARTQEEVLEGGRLRWEIRLR